MDFPHERTQLPCLRDGGAVGAGSMTSVLNMDVFGVSASSREQLVDAVPVGVKVVSSRWSGAVYGRKIPSRLVDLDDP